MSDMISKQAAIRAVFDWEQGKISGTIADAIAALPPADDAVEALVKAEAALVEAKREMWIGTRDRWTMADFKNWAVIQQIDAALAAIRGGAK